MNETPTPPEGFHIIPRAYLEAGNPLPEDAIYDTGLGWRPSMLGGATNRTAFYSQVYATTQQLPCFQSPDQGPERIAPEPTAEQRIGEPEVSSIADALVEKLSDENTTLQKRIAELERERDEAMAEADAAISRGSAECSAKQKAWDELERLRAQLAASEKDRDARGKALEKFKAMYPNSPHIIRIVDDAMKEAK